MEIESKFKDCPELITCTRTIRCCDCEVYAFEIHNVPEFSYFKEDDLNNESDGWKQEDGDWDD